MARIKALLITLLLTLVSTMGLSQPTVKWSVKLVPSDVRAGEATQIHVQAELGPESHIYKVGQTGGPTPTEIELKANPSVEALLDVLAPEPKTKFDKNFNVDVGYYEGKPIFALPVRIAENAKGSVEVEVRIKSQVCDAVSCDRPKEEFLKLKIDIQAGETRTDRIAANLELPEQPVVEATPKSDPGSGSEPIDPATGQPGKTTIWGIFALGFGAGLLALLTPCVFPMIPVTISFFTKQSGDDQKKLIRTALIYCLGIIVSFTGLGIAVTLALGKNGTQILANNVGVNLFLFLLFIVLAMSLFGVFELVLPAKFTSKVDQLGSKGGSVIAPLLMGLTFALTSFTCTVPVVGGLLAGVASGDTLYPTIGMLGFSGALALPFFLLAFFPTLLKKMPKAGGWMVTVKAFMGFLELAAALKFLSNIDLVLDWNFLTRPVFLSVWFAIFIVAGLYLYGWIKLPHDSNSKIGWLRRAFAIATLGIAVSCLMAMNGRSLGAVQGLLPPKDYGVPTNALASTDPNAWIKDDFEAAKAKSKELNLPILIDFTGET